MKILIIEDEPVIAQRLQRFCQRFFATEQVSIQCLDDVHEAMDWLSERTVDLVLLDLNLNGRDGFELLQRCNAGAFYTIVVSAHTDQALQAFEYGVLDFVAKPFSQARLEKALARIKDVQWRSDTPMNYLAVKSAGGLQLIAIVDVNFIRASGHYSELVLHNGQVKLHDKSIDKLGRLLPNNFERIHRSYLVPLQQIQKLIVDAGGKYTAALANGIELPIGRSRYAALKEKLLG